MNLSESSTDDGWCFAWRTPAGHRVELEWVHAKEAWIRRARPADPDGSLGGWTKPQPWTLAVPDDHDDARAIATREAERKP